MILPARWEWSSGRREFSAEPLAKPWPPPAPALLCSGGTRSTVKLELQQMLAKNNQEEDARLRSLVRIYESMKPKEAALIFDKLETTVLIGVVERMKENKVAPILASMQPDRARQVTDMLADKSQRPPARR